MVSVRMEIGTARVALARINPMTLGRMCCPTMCLPLAPREARPIDEETLLDREHLSE